MTETEDDYGKVRMGIWLPKRFLADWKRYLSRKWPEYSHGILSLEVQLAMKLWMENDGRAAHTHKNTVFVEAENKPNFHVAKTKGKLIKLSTNSPDGMTALSVWGDGEGNGNGKDNAKDEDSKEFWKRPINEDPLIVDWAKQLGMEDVLENPRNIHNYASKETIENTRRCMVDPEFKKQYHERLLRGLLARKGQKVYVRRLDEGDKRLRDELVVIKKYLWENQHYDQQNVVRQKHLHDAFIFATGKNDIRSFNNKLHEYDIYGYFKPKRSIKSVAYEAQEKLFQLY